MDLVSARRLARRLPQMVDDTDYYPLQGGLNLVDPALSIKPGQLLAVRNYEPGSRGGYERIAGFERFDGRQRPSESPYFIFDFDAGIPAFYPAAGATITGMTSAATGVVLVTPDSTTTSGFLVVGRISGTFEDDEGLQTGGQQFATAGGLPAAGNADNDGDDETYKALAVADARAQIQAVAGSGPIRGVAEYRGTAYAFRDNAGATAGVMWKSSPTGWQQVGLGHRLAFTAGTDAPLIGETLTGGTSAATAVVRQIVVTSGDWSTNDAAGYFIVASITGTFQAETVTSASGSATASGAQVANTLPAGGTYEFRVHNFYGHAGTLRLYGVNGVGQAFEYQDSPEFFCPIATGMTTDAPTHLAVHKSCLWLSFAGGSVQKSGAGRPTSWAVVTGAAELGVGDDVTGFLEEVSQTLFVFSRQSTRYIAGNEADGYAMDNFTVETGALPRTIQRIGKGLYLDDRGFTMLAAAQEYGNFSSSSVSEQITPLLDRLREAGTVFTASVVSRSKNRARFFLSDSQFITVGFTGNRVNGFTTSDYGKVVRCAYSGETADGREFILFGSDDGFVYEADRGTSLDGEVIQAFIRPVFHHSGGPSRIKRYRLARVDITTRGPTTLFGTVDYSYSDPDASGEPIKDLTILGGGGFWNVSNWNEFRWSSGVVATATMKLEGSGYNVGLLFSSESATEEPHLLSGVNFHISTRRINRSTGVPV